MERLESRSGRRQRNGREGREERADLHESPFLLSSETRHVHPGRRLPLPHVVSLLLDRSERDPS
jgi:hypothetical protein